MIQMIQIKKMTTLCVIDDKINNIVYQIKYMINKIDGEMDELKR